MEHNLIAFCFGYMDIMPIYERQNDINMLIVCITSLIAFVLFIFVKTFYKGYYKNLFYSFFIIDNSSSSESIDKNIINVNANAIILISSVLSISTAIFTLFTYSGFLQYNNSYSSGILIFKILLFVIGFLLFKWFIVVLLGWIYEKKKQIDIYLSYILDLIRILGITILPVTLLVPFVSLAGNIFVNIFTVAIILSFIITLIYKFVIFFSNSIKIKFFNHYTILYFCTLEILPILFLLKMIL